MTRLRLLLGLAALLCVGAVALFGFVRRPAHAFLVPVAGAEWIRGPRPFDLSARGLVPETTSFRFSFDVPDSGAPPGPLPLYVQALRSFRVFLNYREIGAGGADTSSWRNARSFDLAGQLKPGGNELRIEVQNDRGLPALLAHAPALGIETGADWVTQNGADGKALPALPVRSARRHTISDSFPSAWQPPSQPRGFPSQIGTEFPMARRVARRALLKFEPSSSPSSTRHASGVVVAASGSPRRHERRHCSTAHSCTG